MMQAIRVFGAARHAIAVSPVHCAGGYRSSIAASILHQYGITNLMEMAGGLAAWDAAKLPVVLGA